MCMFFTELAVQSLLCCFLSSPTLLFYVFRFCWDFMPFENCRSLYRSTPGGGTCIWMITVPACFAAARSWVIFNQGVRWRDCKFLLLWARFHYLNFIQMCCARLVEPFLWHVQWWSQGHKPQGQGLNPQGQGWGQGLDSQGQDQVVLEDPRGRGLVLENSNTET